MKRPSRSFVVEVRRQRRPPGEPAPSWTEELQKPQPKPQPNVAAREAEPPPRSVAEAATLPARPTGRILPSLIEAATPAAPPTAARPPKPAKTAKPAKTRAQRRGAQASAPQPIRVAEPPLAVAAPPPVADRAAETPDQDRSARHRRILARYVFGDASKPGERWKRRLRDNKS
ncbi:MAG: hypothetical protein ABSF49_09910 [Roseiarcus sp.]|jgi:hypothetical protein|uniref:hypothetical protein n=1 Tax=Roseiarcus sp. TaxID=1969460 RepID=UPI003C1E6B27